MVGATHHNYSQHSPDKGNRLYQYPNGNYHNNMYGQIHGQTLGNMGANGYSPGGTTS